MAKIDLGDGEVINVGKTKIELATPKKSAKKAAVGIVCSNCGNTNTMEQLSANKGHCHDCNEDLAQETTGRIAEGHEYTQCKAHSGRTSCDNADDVASKLRGLSLEDAYTVVAKTMKMSEKDLIAKYAHLNPGHQRMCIGNRLRGYLRNQ